VYKNGNLYFYFSNNTSVDVITLKQAEYIQQLTTRPIIGYLSFEEISKRIGKNVWKISKKEASEIIDQLQTIEGLNKFLEK
jgi:hypothetical protein